MLLSLPRKDLVSAVGRLWNILHRDFIRDLPSEVAIEILKYLSPTDCLAAAQVNKHWHNLCSDNALWHTFCLNTIPHFKSVEKLPAQHALRLTPGLDLNYRLLYQMHLKLRSNWQAWEYNPISLIGHEEGVYCFQLDGYLLVSGSRDDTIVYWDIRTGYSIRTLRGHDASVLCLHFNDRYLVSGSSDAKIIVWEKTSGQRLKTITGHTDSVLSLRLLDNDHIVSAGKDGTIRIWDIATRECLHILEGHRAAVNCVCVTPDWILSASGDRHIKMWSRTTYTCIRTFIGHGRGIACVQYDGTHIISGSSDHSIRVWDPLTGECLKVLTGHTDLVRTLYSDGKWIVSGSYDESVRVWDKKTWEMVHELEKEHEGRILKVMFNQTHLVSCSQDNTICVRDFTMGKEGLDVFISG